MRPLRALLVGYGQMGRHHARVLQTMDDVELVGVVDPAGSAGGSAVPEVLELEGALARGVDLAVVAVPTVAHEAVALRLAEAGVHALIEKPVAVDVETSRRIGDAFEQRGLIGCVGHIERYNPSVQELRRRLAQGALGDIYQIVTRRQGPFPERITDVGVILDLATHDIDLTSWVSQSSYADVSVRTAHRSGHDREDLVAAVGCLEDGTVVNHLVNWLSPLKERVTIVSGEHGTFVADTLTADLTFYANGAAPVDWETLASFRGVVAGDVTRFAIAKKEPLLLELLAFVEAVRGGEDRTVSVRDASRVVDVAQTMMRAAMTSETERPARRAGVAG
jgi:UDP-N-acetylglucosamine 3-dehydrogenase